MAKLPKDLPPKAIKIGDLVTTNRQLTGWTYNGFVIGDHLSPGGMNGCFMVAFLFSPMFTLTQTTGLLIKPAIVPAELLTILDGPPQFNYSCEPVAVNQLYDWMEWIAKMTQDFKVRPADLVSIDPRLDVAWRQ